MPDTPNQRIQAESRGGDPIAAAAVLAEPVRRALYEHVAGRDEPVDRDEAAAATGIGRPLAAFHLDRLVAAVSSRSSTAGEAVAPGPARAGRRSSTAGRAISMSSCHYPRGDIAWPRRSSPRVSTVDRTTTPATRSGRRRAIGARRSADREGGGGGISPVAAKRRSRKAARKELVSVLARQGFEPTDDGREIRLRNCPFDVLAAEHRDLTCSMNLALLEGVLTSGIGDAGLQAVARPVEGSCCVRFEPAR